MLQVIIMVAGTIKAIDQTINKHKYIEKQKKKMEEWNQLTPKEQADRARYSIFM